MLTITISSTNPVKINATKRAFEAMLLTETFDLKPLEVVSGVSHQPINDEETLQGALNRVQSAQKAHPDSDYWVGIEGGVEFKGSELEAFAWVVIRSADLVSKSRTGTFLLPKEIAKLISQGKELGEADDIVFKRSDSKKKDGAVGILTSNIIDRTAYYEHAVILALIPFKTPELY